ncbi:MAG: penicillin acylase family protein [Nocardioidaceae bacterium]
MRAATTFGVVLAASVSLVLTAAAPSVATPPRRPDPYGKVWNILPPGQRGTITTTDLAKVVAGDPTGRVAVDGKNAPKNFADQLEMYDRLNRIAPRSLTRADLSRYYKDAGFVPQRVVSTSRPIPGLTIRRDEFGVPFIHGRTYQATMYGAGYAGTKDRMFLMDVLRHAGAADLAQFAGGSAANLAMDRAQLRTAYYTRREAAAQVVRLARAHGRAGEHLLRGADAFLRGINAAQQAMCPTIAASTCPAEYAALQKTPTPWTRADLVYVASLVGGIFGKGGGREYADAKFWERLRRHFPRGRALQIYNELREKNDPNAPTTATVRTPYAGGGLHPGRPGVALPDLFGRTAPGTGHEISGGPLPRAATSVPGTTPDVVTGPFGPIDLSLTSHGMSNALLVSAKHSKTGHPIAVFGPQTGYYTPQLLTEEVLVGPGVRARGVSFAGTQLVVELGRGTDYAWSATSASGDNVDTVAERLCNRDGSRPTVHSTSYRVGRRCVPMRHDVHTEQVVPNASAQTAPKTYKFDVWRTRHGIVQLRTTVHRQPVAIVLQRSTYGHEVDSILGFSQLNDPRYVRGAASFQRAVSHIGYTFNWFYADSRDISYYSSGKLPIRAQGTDTDLPRWGDRRYDWKGWLSFARHVHQTDPPRGYLVSWNNKPAPGFSAADDVWGYGSVYRSLALSDRVRAAIANGARIDAAGLVGAMASAMTVDSRARYTLPWLLKVIGNDPRTRAARSVLRSWLASGAHRVDRRRTGHYGHQQAIALFDAWWQDGRHSVAYDLVGSRLGARLTRQLPQALDDHPRLGRGSAWNDVAWYGYVNKDLRQLLGRPLRAPYPVPLCGRGSLARCRTLLRVSLLAAVRRVESEQGVSSVAALAYDKSQDDIRSNTAGVVGVRPIDWQNRPTFQQVVSFVRHRPR